MSPQGKKVAHNLLSAACLPFVGFFGFFIVVLGGLGLLGLADHFHLLN